MKAVLAENSGYEKEEIVLVINSILGEWGGSVANSIVDDNGSVIRVIRNDHIITIEPIKIGSHLHFAPFRPLLWRTLSLLEASLSLYARGAGYDIAIRIAIRDRSWGKLGLVSNTGYLRKLYGL